MQHYLGRIICAAALFVQFISLPAVAVETTTYKYDALGRVIESTVSSGPTSGTQTTVTYDPAGNRSNYKVVGAAQSTSANLSVSNASVTEGGSLVFTITRSGNTTIAASASYASENGTATASSDYTAASGTINFAANETSQTISIGTIDDSIVELAETLTVTLSAPSANTTISAATATGTINDNDIAPADISIGSASVTEGGTLSFSVTRSGNTGIAASANYASADGTAVSGSDYTAVSGTVNFSAGETSKTISVATIDDSTVESAETLTVSLSTPGANTTISAVTAVGTINDNDTSLSIAAPGAVIEGAPLSFAVTRIGSTSGSTSVNYATADGTATAVSDYTATNGTLIFAAGETTKTITVATINDGTIESAETLSLSLSSPSANTTISTATATATINDDDVSLSIADPASVTEGSTLTFTVTRTGSTANVSTNVSYTSADGSALAGSDYTAASGTLTFAAGETTKTITIETIDDSIIEPTETLTVSLSAATGGATISTATAMGTIGDNDVSLSVVTPVPATEGTPLFELAFTVTRTGTTNLSTSVNYATFDGTAIAGSDYTAVSGTLTFAAGETTKTVAVSTIDDSTIEPTESMTLTLSGASGGATISSASANGTINDNDASLAIAQPTVVTEGTPLLFTVTRTGGTNVSTSVNYATANGSAIAGSDYTSSSGTLVFAAGETSKTITVATVDDSGIEPTETLTVNLSGATNGAIITTASSTGTINDDDVGIGVSAISAVTEGTSLSFNVTRAGTTNVSTNVNYSTADGTASAGGDYTPTSGTLTFAAGETAKTITVTTIDDTVLEASETLTVTLSGATGGATISTPSATGTINDNEVGLSIAAPFTVTEGTSISDIAFNVTRTGPTGGTTSVNYATANGTAIAGSDYVATSGTLTFAPGQTSKTIYIQVLDDNSAEPAETLIVNLSGATGGAGYVNSSATGTIIDND